MNINSIHIIPSRPIKASHGFPMGLFRANGNKLWVRGLSLCTCQVAHQTGAYTGFCSMKRLENFYPLLDGMLVYYRVTPSIMGRQYPFIHL